MKSPLSWMIFSLFLPNLCLSSFTQEQTPRDNPGQWNELYKTVVNLYEFDQVLQSGICYEDNYRGKEGHPFLLEDQFYNGTLSFRGKEYQQMEMKYDVYKQQLILCSTHNNSVTWIIPPNDFISAFSLADKRFEKLSYEGLPKYYQIIFDTKQLKCLYYWYKLRSDMDDKKGFNFSQFSDSKKKTYLVINDNLVKYSNNKSFVRLFPQESQLQIKKFIKGKKINVAKTNESEIYELLKYCISL